MISYLNGIDRKMARCKSAVWFGYNWLIDYLRLQARPKIPELSPWQAKWSEPDQQTCDTKSTQDFSCLCCNQWVTDHVLCHWLGFPACVYACFWWCFASSFCANSLQIAHACAMGLLEWLKSKQKESVWASKEQPWFWTYVAWTVFVLLWVAVAHWCSIGSQQLIVANFHLDFRLVLTMLIAFVLCYFFTIFISNTLKSMNC